jgi:hypothetical protein
VRTIVDGRAFASKREAARYQELRLLLRAGKIHDLRCQPVFACVVNGHLVCNYLADFQYFDIEKKGNVVEDVKGVKTAVYKLKKKLVSACWAIQIREVA